MFKEDLHLHTEYSPDSQETYIAHINSCIEKKVDVMCFTDHVDTYGPGETFSNWQPQKRNAEYERYRKQFDGQIKMLQGIEFGEPNLAQDIYKKVLNEYDYDMVIGSVHYPMELVFAKIHNDHKLLSQMQHKQTYEMVKVGGFDVLGHLDFPKKFINDYVLDTKMCEEILKICVDKGIVLEINTSTLYRGQFETSPTMEMVEYYRSVGGKYVTISSDSHKSITDAYDYEKVFNALPKGIKVCYFEKRKLIEATNEL